MKKQKFTLVSLTLKKINIANLSLIGGADPLNTGEVECNSTPIVCPHTVTTRPDSLKHAQNADG